MDFLMLLVLTVVAAVVFAVVLWIAMARIVGRERALLGLEIREPIEGGEQRIRRRAQLGLRGGAYLGSGTDDAPLVGHVRESSRRSPKWSWRSIGLAPPRALRRPFQLERRR